MADGKVVIETDLDSSGIEKGLSKIGGLAVKGLSVATGAITGTATALGGVSIAAIKAGSLDSSGIEKGLSKIGGLAVKGLSVATGAITGTATALGGVSIAAIKAGSDLCR